MPLNSNPDQAFITYLEHLEVEGNVSQLTIRNYSQYIRRFLDWYKGQGLNDLQQVNPDVMRSYRLYLARFTDELGQTLSKKTQGYYIIALRSWFKWLVKNDVP